MAATNNSTDAAQLIAKHLPTGLPHPGNPANNQPPTLIPIPGFRTTGMPNEMATAINAAAATIGEAIICLLETKGGYQLTTAPPASQSDITGIEHTIIRCRKCQQPLLATTGDVDIHALKKHIAALDTHCGHHQQGQP